MFVGHVEGELEKIDGKNEAAVVAKRTSTLNRLLGIKPARTGKSGFLDPASLPQFQK